MTKHKKTRSKAFYHTHLLCIISIAIVLFIVGCLGLAEIAGNAIRKEVEEQIAFNILLKEGNSDEENKALCTKMEREPFVQRIRYISANEVAEELGKELGEDPVMVLGYNPLQPQMQVYVKSEYAHPDSLPIVDTKIRAWDSVERLSYRQDLFHTVHTKIKATERILLILAIVLLIISFIQINNTTRLLIYSKRYQIRTLSLVGASAAFIRRPFVWHSVFDGLFGATLACLLLLAAIFALDKYQLPMLWNYLPLRDLGMLAVTLLMIGSLVSAFTAYRAARRYVRMDGSKMYLI